MTSATKEAVQRIKDAGFSHIKFELEANIGRDGGQECYDCEGTGHRDCDECEGSGAICQTETVGQIEVENHYECEECYGEGRNDCNNCEGSGEHGAYMDEDDCQRFLLNYVERVKPEALEHLDYKSFYEDGSVDSEFTYTHHIDYLEDFKVWCDAFKALADNIGGELDVSGAGMHITLLQSGDYENQPALDYGGMRNFRREVTKLLPALYFVASAGHQSRGLGYRRPQISNDDKYSAIYTHGDTCIEYRLFETCYDNPTVVDEYIQAIANTLKFYTEPNRQVKQIGTEFGFSEGYELARFYNTPEQLRILNASIKEIQPKGKSLRQMKIQRGVHYTIKGLAIEEKKRMAKLHQEWNDHQRHVRESLASPLTESEQREVDFMITEHGRTLEDAVLRIRGYSRRAIISFDEFVQNNNPSTNRGYLVTV